MWQFIVANVDNAWKLLLYLYREFVTSARESVTHFVLKNDEKKMRKYHSYSTQCRLIVGVDGSKIIRQMLSLGNEPLQMSCHAIGRINFLGRSDILHFPYIRPYSIKLS